MFFLQFLNLDVSTLHPFVLEANADVVDGQDGMSAIRAPHVGVKVELYGLPCLLRVDVIFDLVAKAIDIINRKNGHDKIRIAVQGDEKGWQLKREYISKQYTTNLDDVIVLKVK